MAETEPIWAAALRACNKGLLSTPPREPTIRPEDEPIDETLVVDGYCCETFAFHVNSTCTEHPNRLDCRDTILHRYKFGYGIPIHDGGWSHVNIAYYPWCGTKLDGPNDILVF